MDRVFTQPNGGSISDRSMPVVSLSSSSGMSSLQYSQIVDDLPSYPLTFINFPMQNSKCSGQAFINTLSETIEYKEKSDGVLWCRDRNVPDGGGWTDLGKAEVAFADNGLFIAETASYYIVWDANEGEPPARIRKAFYTHNLAIKELVVLGASEHGVICQQAQSKGKLRVIPYSTSNYISEHFFLHVPDSMIPVENEPLFLTNSYICVLKDGKLFYKAYFKESSVFAISQLNGGRYVCTAKDHVMLQQQNGFLIAHLPSGKLWKLAVRNARAPEHNDWKLIFVREKVHVIAQTRDGWEIAPFNPPECTEAGCPSPHSTVSIQDHARLQQQFDALKMKYDILQVQSGRKHNDAT